MKKKLLVMLILSAILIAEGEEVRAAQFQGMEETQYHLNYVQTSGITTYLAGNMCGVHITGDNSTSSISVTLSLYKYEGGRYVYKTGWSKTENSKTLSMSNIYFASSGNYKLVARVTSISNGKSETVTKTSTISI